MKLMKSGIEIDAEKQEKIKGGTCVCYCGIGVIARQPQIHAVNGDLCICGCENPEELYGASIHMQITYG